MQKFGLSRNVLLAVGAGVVVVVAAAAFFLMREPLGPGEGPSAPLDTEGAVAIVNGEKILREDFEARLEAQTYFYTVIAPLPQEEQGNLRQRVLEEMIEEKLLVQLLVEYNMVLSDEEVLQYLYVNTVEREHEGDWAAYELDLANTYHTTLSEIMRNVRLILLRGKVSEQKTQKHVFAIVVDRTEPQFSSEETLPADERVRLAAVNASKKQLAEWIFERVQAGDDFALLATSFSDDPEVNFHNGDLGFLFNPTEPNDPQQPALELFPGKMGVMLALREMGENEVRLYDTLASYVVVKVGEVHEGVRGEQSFADWYSDYRANANVLIVP